MYNAVMLTYYECIRTFMQKMQGSGYAYMLTMQTWLNMLGCADYANK